MLKEKMMVFGVFLKNTAHIQMVATAVTGNVRVVVEAQSRRVYGKTSK
jgi:hypothetical protein